MRYNDVGEPIGRFAVRNGAFIHPIAAECYDCLRLGSCYLCPVATRELCGEEYDESYGEEQYQRLADLI